MLIAVRGNDKLFLEKEDEGKRTGRIELEDGTVVRNVNVDSVLSRGYWSEPPAAHQMKSANMHQPGIRKRT